MDTILQALIMGIVQGLTEFLPVSSSGHLVIVPYLFGWDDAFINSLAFSVMLHMGTLIALLVYFRADWVRLVPAGFATIRDRSFRDDPDRRLAPWEQRKSIATSAAWTRLGSVPRTRHTGHCASRGRHAPRAV